ncbi:hypothetical protein D3C72_640140 [compost metagenome]
MLQDEAQIAGHGRPVLIHHGGVAITLPGGPGQDHPAVGPARRGAQAQFLPAGGGIVRELAARALGVANVAGEALGEGGHVHVEGCGVPEDVGVAGPAQTLVALRTVGGHAEEVGPLAPQGVAP